jgi:TonB family protein
MRAAVMGLGLALAMEVGAAPVMEAQARAADLVTAARAQLGAGNVDSGLVLVGLALDSSTLATGRDRVNAFVWRGVLQFYKGRDSLARESFRDALTIDPRLEVAGLAQIDSLLAVEFEAVRRSVQPPPTAARPSAALARLASGPPLDTLYSCVPECRGLDQPPRPLPAESEIVTVRSGGATPIMGGVAVVRFVVDSTGGVEPASIAVVSSPSPALAEALADHVRPVRFSPGRVQGRAVRVLLQWRLTLRSR